MNAGKQFENDFKDSISPNIWWNRYKDSPATFDMNKACLSCPQKKEKTVRFALKNICDYELYLFPNLFLLELKSTSQKSLSFTNVEKSKSDATKVKKLTDANRNKGITSGYVVNFRAVNETYFLGIEGYNYCKKHLDRKSIPLDFFREHGLLLEQEKKKIHWRYNVSKFLFQLTNGTKHLEINGHG